MALTHWVMMQYIAYNAHHTLNDSDISMSTDDKTWPEIDRRNPEIRDRRRRPRLNGRSRRVKTTQPSLSLVVNNKSNPR